MESNQDKGKQHAALVWDYARRVSLSQVPTNQWGRASRQRILQVLQISKSAKDNASVKEAFDFLDERLGKEPGQHFSVAPASSAEYAALEKRYRELEKRYAALKAELVDLRRMSRLQNWFLETGRMPRL